MSFLLITSLREFRLAYNDNVDVVIEFLCSISFPLLLFYFHLYRVSTIFASIIKWQLKKPNLCCTEVYLCLRGKSLKYSISQDQDQDFLIIFIHRKHKKNR